MQKLEYVRDFQKRTFELEVKLQNLIDEMTAYTAQCHEAKIMLKRYNRLLKSKEELFKTLRAADSEMDRTVGCIHGELG